ncbi:MAG TPA: hypothetical protein VK864_04575 [Longimicrobiales bacterium]|nr:hypothetical protein [Longimicrobiales bacterium]
MTKHLLESRREGFALAGTILAMLVVGAVVTGGFYAASQEGQVARSSGSADDAMFLAETGLSRVVAQTTKGQLAALPVNTSINASPITVNSGGTVLGSYVSGITRLSNELFLVRSTGTISRGRYGGATRTLANVIRFRSMAFDHETAVMVYGGLTVGGNALVDGTDDYPAAWAAEGCTTVSSSAAVTTNPGTQIKTQGSGDIVGATKRTSLAADSFTVFGDVTWNELVGMREKVYPHNTTVGPDAVFTLTDCIVSAPDNWGSPLIPTNPCFDYAPIIHAEGDLRISSSSTGQGILLVEGDLEISGGFNFYGIAVVLGEVTITGTGGHINGTSMVYGGGNISSTSTTLGDAALLYSSCAIERAILNNESLSRGFPIAHRSWLDLSAIRGGN